MPDLFESSVPPPLAERMRPRTLDEFVGQNDLVGEGKILRRILERGKLDSSIIFWGPPGSGKTTLARIISRAVDAHFEFFSAVTAGIQDDGTTKTFLVSPISGNRFYRLVKPRVCPRARPSHGSRRPDFRDASRGGGRVAEGVIECGVG